MKKCLALLLTAIMLVSVTACGGTPAQEPATAPSQESQPGSSQSPAQSSEPSNAVSTTPDSGVVGPDGEPEPNVSDFEAAEATMVIEFPTESGIRITVNDPYLFEAYYVNASMFSLTWEVSLADDYDTIVSYEAELLQMSSSYPIVVGATAIQDESSQYAAMTVDCDTQTIVWEQEVGGGDSLNDRITRINATVKMKYGFDTAEKEMSVHIIE